MAPKRLGILVALLGLAIAGVGYGSAQAVPGTFVDANHPAGASDPEKLDAIWQVDPMSGQVSITIPFTTTPQGGRGPKIPFTLLYNSASTMTLQDAGTFGTGLQELGVLQLGNPPTTTALRWNPPNSTTSAISPAGPWTTSGPYFYSTSSTIGSGGYNPQSGQYQQLGCDIGGPYSYVDETGSAHDTMLEEYQPNTNNPATGAGPLPLCTDAQRHAQWPTSATSDGSAMSASDGIVTYPDGTVFQGGHAGGTTPYALHQLTDANGNTASLTISGGVTTATDALGRPVFATNLPVGKPGLTAVGSYYVHTPTESGGTASYGITYANVSIQAFTMPHPNTGDGTNLNDIYFYGSWSGTLSVRQPQANATFPTITQVSRPDGSSYQFQYDTTYGVVSKIIFPTGGYVRFRWTIRPYSWVPYGMFAAISDIVVTDVYTSTGDGNEDHWTYDLISQDPATSSTNSLIPSSVYSTVTAPDQSYIRYSYVSRVVSGQQACFSHTMSTLGSIPKASCKPAYTRYYDSHGTLIKTVDESFNGHGLPLRTVTTLYDGTTPLQQQARYTYDTWDNVIEKDESDFYSCSGQPCTIPTSLPSWIRETYTTYAYTSNTNLANAHIVNKPSQVLITDGSGVPYALTNYGYDSHGNLTLETKCITITGTGTSATCSSPWQTQYSYDTTGQLTQKVEGYQSTLPATTNYTWTSGYLTSVQHPNGAFDSYTYYPAIGSVKTHTDWNGQTTGLSTSYDYSDPLNRIRSITSPSVVDGATGSTASAVTQLNYTDTAGDFSVEEKHSVDAAGTMTSTTKSFDGLGRLSNVSTAAASSQCGTGTIQSDTTYDLMGRVYTVSNPYCTTSETTYGLTTYLYDALGRKTQITLPDSSVSTTSYGGNATQTTDPSNGTTSVQHIQQVNGLGMLTDVCEVTSSALGSDSSPAACNLNIAGTGYLTHYIYSPVGDLVSVDQHGMSRSFQYDGLSRLTRASNPEAGATQYTYSTQGLACSPDPSVPCKRTDARGVITAYGYDSMSRLTSKSYSAAATNSVGTVSDLGTCYQYDTKLSSATDSDPAGRLTAEWEQAGACPTSAVTAIPSGAIAVRIPSNHDALGRVGADRQCLTASACSASVGSFAYSYNLLGLPAQSNNGIAAATVSATQVAGTNSSTAFAPSATWKSTYDLAGHLTQTVVQDQPSASIWPAGNTGAAYSFAPTVISATNYDPFGHLTGAQIGIPNNSTIAAVNLASQYDARGRLQSETYQGLAAQSQATGSVGTITVSPGPEQSKTIQGSSATAGQATVSYTFGTPGAIPRTCITVNSISACYTGAAYATASTVAAGIVSAVNSSAAPVTASGGGGSTIYIYLTAKTTGASTNYSLSVTSDGVELRNPSYPSTLKGGANAVAGGTFYDTGTITAVVGGKTASASWAQGSTSPSLASSLASAINTSAGSIVTASASGSTISLLSKGLGASTNYNVSLTSTDTQTTYFSSPSFTAAGSNMTGGTDAIPSYGTLYTYTVPTGGYAPNGDILQHTDSVMGTWSFTYDAVDRLVTSHAGSGVPSAYANMYGCWVYDSFGSRTAESMSTTACTASPARASWATYNYTAPNNRMTTSSYATGGVQYDASGDTSYDGRNSYWYDAEGRVCAVQTMSGGIVQYVYGPEGERIAQGTLSSAPSSIYSLCAPPSANGSTLTNSLGLSLSKRYLVDTGGTQITELNGSGTWQHSNVFAGGKLIATYDGKGLHFSISDPLGTKRLQANIQGQVDEKCTSLPFGNDLNNPLTASCSGTTNSLQTNSDATEHHFTGKERDAESGNDYFGARYFGSSMGRFLSPDYADMNWGPVDIPGADYEDPQSLNLYSYVHNNPLSNVDPDGHDVKVCDNNGKCNTVSNDQYKAAQQASNKGGLNAPTLDQVGNSKDANGNFTSVGITDSSGKQVGTATYVPGDNPGIDPYVGNNMAGLQTLGAANKVVTVAAAVTGVEVAAMGVAVAAPEVASLAARQGIKFALKHGMRWEAGHSMVMGTAAEVKAAVASAVASGIASGTIQQGVIKGQTMVNGTIIAFTGFMNSAGQVTISNVMGGFYNK